MFCGLRTSSLALMALTAASLLGACSSDDPPSAPPKPRADHPVCVVSADCPAGTHCDLGECVQSCNTEQPCDSSMACSARARCLPPEQPDVEQATPAPPQGVLTVTPKSALLKPGDTELLLHLTSSTGEPVRYRLEASGAHLKVDEPRGSFVGSTDVRVRVDRTAVQGVAADGSVRIVSTIGDTMIDAPLQAGLGGYYHGTMSYQAPLALGSASLAIDLTQRASDVQVRVDPAASTLFPTTAEQPVTGQGRVTEADGVLDFTILQKIDPDVAGARNHFMRPFLRRVRFLLRPGPNAGTVDGTFDEEVTGLFAASVHATGRASFTLVANRAPATFDVAFPSAPPSPVAGEYAAPRDVFGWSGPETKCSEIAALACTLLPSADQQGCKNSPTSALPKIVASASSPLYKALGNHVPYTTLAAACKGAVEARSSADYTPGTASCGMPAPLACSLELLDRNATDPVVSGKAYVDAVSKVVGPSLLVAQEEIANALQMSLHDGLAAERAQYEDANSILHPTVRWLLQPSVLEHLRVMPGPAARGPDDATQPWPAAFALTDLFTTLSTLDAEQSRVTAATAPGSASSGGHIVQQRAVVSYLEALAFAEIINTWREVPSNVAVRYGSALGPLDRGFAAVANGANAFGVPSGYVPFVYSPDQASQGASNFEQTLAQATRTLAVEASFETTFVNEDRLYDLDRSSFQRELGDIATRYDDELRGICGPSFQPPSAGTVDWTKCGADGVGQYALATSRSVAAEDQARVLAARVRARADEMAVSERTLRDVLKLRADEISFRLTTGVAINAISDVQGVLGAVSHGLQVAAQAEFWNAGAPIAEAAVVIVLDTISAGLDSLKRGLQLAIDARSAYTGLNVERLKGVEALQREWIEVHQLAVEAEAASRALVVGVVERRTLLDRAQTVVAERSRALDMANSDPARNPAVRLLRARAALDVLRSRADAQQKLWRAARALSYEINDPLPAAEGAVLGATNARQLVSLSECLRDIFDEYVQAYRAPQTYPTEVSVRKLLGVEGPRVDDVTGQSLSEGEQFRLLLQAQRSGLGAATVEFATTLQEGNGLWSSAVCNDRVATVEAQLVGDFLGDNDARVEVSLLGTGFQRSCGAGDVVPWQFGQRDDTSAIAVSSIQAGVNSFGAAPPNNSLYGQPVARATWRVSIPPASVEPANADVNVLKVDDIILRITHRAPARRPGASPVSSECLSR
jgi:hypothetical protein